MTTVPMKYVTAFQQFTEVPASKTPTFFAAVLVTPLLAAKLLEHNVENRKLKRSHITTLTRKLLNGEWDPKVVDPIVLDREGVLRNGQHRLTAIVESGVSVLMQIQTGVEGAVVQNIDTGVARSTADVYGLVTGDKKNASAITTRARSVSLAFNRHREKFVFQDAQRIVEEFQSGIRMTVQMVTRRDGIGSAQVMAAFAIAGTARPGSVRALLADLINGEVKTPAAKLLHRYIFMGNGLKVDSENDRTEKVLFGIYAHLEGLEPERLQSGKDMALHFAKLIAEKNEGQSTMCTTYIQKTAVAAA